MATSKLQAGMAWWKGFMTPLIVAMLIPVLTAYPLPYAFMGDMLAGGFILSLGGFFSAVQDTLRTVGEEIVDMHLQLFYKHRGVEKRAEHLPIELLPLVAERISGTSAFAHSLALCQALEHVAEVEISPRARFLRTLLAELERLYNHLGYQADLCQATGLTVAQAQLDLLKERVLRLNARISGHRYLFGMNIPGGLSRDLTEQEEKAIQELAIALRRDLETLSRLLLASSSHRDRLEATGILPPEEARTYCAVGPIGRSSGAVGAKLAYREHEIRIAHHARWYGTIAPTVWCGPRFAS